MISYYSINWISQASADQRSGRAGRTGPGFCYRLYSTPVYANIFQRFSEPEIMNSPIENIILQLKAIGISNILKFPFPTPPNFENIKDSIISLVKMKGLKINLKENEDEEQDLVEIVSNELQKKNDLTILTDLGKILVYIPLHPKFAKMLLQARKFNCLGYMLLIVCALSVDQLIKNETIMIDNSLEKDEINDFDENEEIVSYNLIFFYLNRIQ